MQRVSHHAVHKANQGYLFERISNAVDVIETGEKQQIGAVKNL